MTVTLTGKVLKVSKIKDYGHEINFGKDWSPIHKFYMQIESKDQGIINVMVAVKAEQTQYGYKIPENEERQKPLIGDTVKITTHSLKENGNKDKWASVTWNQSFDIVRESKRARKERDKWIEQKKQEREQAFKDKIAEQKQKKIEYELEVLGQLETLKYDERLPESVRERINKTFDFDTILSLLRDTVWFVVPEGEGGQRCLHDPPCGCGYPGTGLRRPGGCLYTKPQTVRTSILKKAIDSGLIIDTEDGYKATELGVKTLHAIDQCPDCGELRKPVDVTGVYTNPASRYTQRTHVGTRYYCEHEIRGILETNRGSNTGTIIRRFKSTGKKLERIMKTLGIKLIPVPSEPIFERVVKENGKRIIQVTRKEYTIVENSGCKRILTPTEHQKKCDSKKSAIPTGFRAMLVCLKCGHPILGGGIGAGMEIENTEYKIIELEVD